MLLDSHAHLDGFGERLPAVLERARVAGVGAIVAIGASDGEASNAPTVAIAEARPNIFATVGVHPHDARIVDPACIERIRALLSHPKVVGVGETGLDYHYDHSPRGRQLEAFRSFVGLARDVAKPLVIHTREAEEDTVRVLREERAKDVGGVFHCFGGGHALAGAALELGFYISFSGVLTFKNAETLREIARNLPRDRALIETDCPFLAPVPMRGKKNEPAFVEHTARRLAELWGVPLDEVGRITSDNARRLFRLPELLDSGL
ncbi:MAG: TatD family hydrolase [Deltaproteobacteria bacterium]|nr:TatD family hydrolase [Deltaproteobacteria bacterium]